MQLRGTRTRSPGRLARDAGLSLIEIMASLTVLLLGVVAGGGVMVVAEQAAKASEERYLEYADLRRRVEALKAQVSKSYPSGVDSTIYTGYTNVAGCAPSAISAQIDPGAAGLASLVRIEITASTEPGEPPVRIVTYARAVD